MLSLPTTHFCKVFVSSKVDQQSVFLTNKSTYSHYAYSYGSTVIVCSFAVRPYSDMFVTDEFGCSFRAFHRS